MFLNPANSLNGTLGVCAIVAIVVPLTANLAPEKTYQPIKIF